MNHVLLGWLQQDRDHSRKLTHSCIVAHCVEVTCRPSYLFNGYSHGSYCIVKEDSRRVASSVRAACIHGTVDTVLMLQLYSLRLSYVQMTVVCMHSSGSPVLLGN